MSGKEQEYIDEVFKSNYIAPLGEYVVKFEESIKNSTDIDYALATVSGTAAIHLALRVLNIREGDVVLTSSFTFIGSVAPIIYQNAIPVFIDCDDSWQLSPILLKEVIKKAPRKPKALIVTHLYGQCADMSEIVSICKEEGIYIIEDAAEALGAVYEDKSVGTFGDFGVFSFNGNKILTTSGGGMLISNNGEWIEKAKFFATQAREDEIYYEHKVYGYNYRMSNVLAAIGVAQMEVLDKRVAKKREIFSWYKDELSDTDEIDFMPEIENSKGNRWLTTLLFKRSDPYKIIRALDQENIESRPLWKPMHLQPVFKNEMSFLNKKSEEMFKRGICLPSGTAIKRSDVSKICEIVRANLDV
jgi:UDP-N-acetylbacillosamine transaminase